MRKLLWIRLLTLTTLGLLFVTTSIRGQVLNLPSTPVTFYADGGDDDSFFQVVLSDVPPGFDVENDLYAGYCASFFDLSSPTGFFHTALLYDSTRTNLPPPFNTDYWDFINYILNHKQGVADDVQLAIWFFTDNLTAGITPAAQAMIDDAIAHGGGFVPHNGQLVAVIVRATDDPSIQSILIEVPTPGAPPSLCDEKIKGSGCIAIAPKDKANFGFHAGIKNGVISGDLNYIDHQAKINVHSKKVTNYEIINTNTRRITFDALINNQPGVAIITVTDNDKPIGPDLFQITLSTGYSAASPTSNTPPMKGCKVDIKLDKPKCPPPSIKITKAADKTVISTNGDSVTYTYVVTNTGGQTVDNITVTDDDGTPGDTSDDFVVGTIATLPPNTSVTLTATLNLMPMQQFLPVGTIVNGQNVIVGYLLTTNLPSGDVQVTFVQLNINDNRYGTGATAATGWSKKHDFKDLVGSDKAEFKFTDGTGKVVLDFFLDYISAASSATFPSGVVSYPSGYGTLGVNGGDGKLVVGSANNILFATTSLTENLRKPQFQSGFLVNSPPETAPLSGVSIPADWDYNNSYTVIVSQTAFGANGFGSVTIPQVHNSPAKSGSDLVIPTNMPCIVNVAVAIGTAGTNTVSATASAQVCFSTPTPPAPFDCDSHISEIRMVWAGTKAIKVVAHLGAANQAIIATINNVQVGDLVTVSGYDNSPNDVTWEIFDAATGAKMGESQFHLSCSDMAMNGPDDCGTPQGNGKTNIATLINDWRLAGLTTKKGSHFVCP